MIDKEIYNEIGGGTDKMWGTKDIPLEVGDFIEGIYIGKKEHTGVKGTSNVYTIETSDGDMVGVWGSTVIDGKFEEIEIGKMVAIEYLGMKTNKNGTSSYKNYYVGVRGIDSVKN